MTFYEAVLGEIGKDASPTGRAVQKMFRQATVIKAQNVLRYYAEDISDTSGFRKQLGALVPPFPYTWLEVGHPDRYLVEGEMHPWPLHGFLEAGVLLQTTDTMGEGVRWKVHYSIFFRFPENMVQIPAGEEYQRYPAIIGYFELDDHGIIIGDEFKMFDPPGPMHPMMRTLLAWGHSIMGDVMLLALSFLNCKNVTLETFIPGAPTPTPEQRRRNIWPKPEHEYHTILINPLRAGKARADTPTSGASDHHQRLHIVRGHFHTYTEDRPLFGRPGLHGQFWIPAHAKGQASGTIEGDYEIDV